MFTCVYMYVCVCESTHIYRPCFYDHVRPLIFSKSLFAWYPRDNVFNKVFPKTAHFIPCVAGVQACPYPGTVIRGRMSTVKFYYAIGDVISFSCDEGLKIKGASVLRCLKHGKWSNSIPTCVPKNDTQR